MGYTSILIEVHKYTDIEVHKYTNIRGSGSILTFLYNHVAQIKNYNCTQPIHTYDISHTLPKPLCSIGNLHQGSVLQLDQARTNFTRVSIPPSEQERESTPPPPPPRKTCEGHSSPPNVIAQLKQEQITHFFLLLSLLLENVSASEGLYLVQNGWQLGGGFDACRQNIQQVSSHTGSHGLTARQGQKNALRHLEVHHSMQVSGLQFDCYMK